MALDKENKDEKSDEIVGLDDGDLNEAGEETGNEGANKTGLLAKYKKFLIPAAIALGSFTITIVGIKFMNASSHNQSEEVAVEGSEHSETSENGNLSLDNINGHNKDSIRLSAENSAIDEPPEDFSIDTAAIMSDLAFLDYTPEMEAEEEKQQQVKEEAESGGTNKDGSHISKMTPQDSVDTLKWFDIELAKLDKAKAGNASKIKELKSLEYKIDQALIKIEQAESARVINLARLYDGMRPEQVGKLFENLDDKAVMAILPRMKSANAAKIMAIMPPKRAARISTKMITVLE